MESQSLTVFAGPSVVGTGDRDLVVSVLRNLDAAGDLRPVLVFDDATGVQVDLDVREASLAAAVSAPGEESGQRGPGRPKLGVVGREVTLLPRHWEWLNAQPGGASVALRKLVEHARRDSAESDRARRSQEAAFRFMTALAGNERGFEEACRALYAGDSETFDARIAEWPGDVADYARRLASGAFGG